MDRSKIDKLIEASYVSEPHEREWDVEVQVFSKLKFAELLICQCAQIAGEAEENEREGRSTYHVLLDYFGLTDESTENSNTD